MKAELDVLETEPDVLETEIDVFREASARRNLDEVRLI
jgi:hypothetical protein